MERLAVGLKTPIETIVRLPSTDRVGGPTYKTTEEKVEDFLAKTQDMVAKGSRLYFARNSLEQALTAFREGNYGIGASVAVKHEGKIYVFNDRNAMVTGRGVHDHAEARAIFRAKRFQKEILENASIPEEERRSYLLVEADEIFDASVHPESQNMDDGLHVFGTLEPCLMCMCIACRAGAKSSLSNALDGNADTIENGFVSSGGGYVIGDKIKNIPQVCQWIIEGQGLEFKLLDSNDTQLGPLSFALSNKEPGALEAAITYLAESEKTYVQGQAGYYARAALQEAVHAKNRGDDARGAVAVLVKNGMVYEFRDGDRHETGLGVKDIAASRVLESARAFEQDFIDRRFLSEEEQLRFQPKFPFTRYVKSANEHTAQMHDGLYLYTSTEPDPQAMFVAMNAKVNLAICNTEDGELVPSPTVSRSQGAAVAIGKLDSLPLKWQRKITESGIQYTLLTPEEGEDLALVEELARLSEEIFVDTREEIDRMLSQRTGGVLEAVPEHFELTYESGDIDIGIAGVSAEINKWIETVRESGGDAYILTNLHGGDFYLSDLKPHLPLNVKYGYTKTSAYSKAAGSAGEKLGNTTVDFCSLDFSQLSENAHVLIVDDIVDSGASLHTLSQYLIEHGINPEHLRSTCLIKRITDSPAHVPTWPVFSVTGTDWYVGRGMQEGGDYRGCRNIYKIPPRTLDA